MDSAFLWVNEGFVMDEASADYEAVMRLKPSLHYTLGSREG